MVSNSSFLLFQITTGYWENGGCFTLYSEQHSTFQSARAYGPRRFDFQSMRKHKPTSTAHVCPTKSRFVSAQHTGENYTSTQLRRNLSQGLWRFCTINHEIILRFLYRLRIPLIYQSFDKKTTRIDSPTVTTLRIKGSDRDDDDVDKNAKKQLDF